MNQPTTQPQGVTEIPQQPESTLPPTQETATPQSPESQQPQIDPFKLKRMQQRLQAEQNLQLGAFAGLGAALIGASVWGMITAFTGFQIGWMAVGVGFLVGWSIRNFGKGIDKSFGLMGAGFSLFGCMLGNLMSVCLVIAEQESMAFMEVVSRLSPVVALQLLFATFHPMDILFYGLAIYWGYKYSFRRLSEGEVAQLAA